jgi:hypothetical protein
MRFTVSLADEFYERLVRKAGVERRSVSSMAALLLEVALTERGSAKEEIGAPQPAGPPSQGPPRSVSAPSPFKPDPKPGR